MGFCKGYTARPSLTPGCRNRKLKCDEGRPDCLRCVKAKLVCGRYILPKHHDVLHPRELQPRTVQPQQQPQQAKFTIYRSIARSNRLHEESEVENRYFRHFQSTAAMSMDGVWGWALWNYLVLQNSHHESFVWHSIVAIGALSKSLETAYAAGMHPHGATVPHLAKLHWQFAMVKYGTAVKLMQEVLSEEMTNPRQALVGCLMVVCFEMLVGNRPLAIKHAQSGIAILRQWQTQMRSQKGKPEPPSLLILSPSPLKIEDEIVEAFQNLDIQIIGLKDGLSTACHEETTDDHDITIASLPTSFSNVRDAQIYLTHIVRRSYHFLATVLPSLSSTSATVQHDGELADELFISRTMNNSGYFPITDKMRTQQAQLATETAAWMHAFAPVIKRLHAEREDQDVPTPCAYNAALMMQMQAITTTILIAGVVMTNELEYEKFRPKFDELVALTTTVIDLRQQRKKDRAWAGGFLVDIGITPQLLVVVTRCRDTAIRRKAIALLEGWYVEGGWDPRLVAQLGLFMIEAEEEGVEDIMKSNEEQDENRIMGRDKARAVFLRVHRDSKTG
ncbi:hypothetical protein BP6252_14106 [Coleophoma cylindrospora]|uniref:Zn(2)-C6 fungal-type domain-containing protein n=1 Tax=Coleophoma cylindrospora TaxID=1849047 RepID=A0A3D8Q3X2_9HELO|nr:hypothetical protein BP6252_14106 [Coleophoma cylindrospora]